MARILVVDDNPVDRTLISRLLEARSDWQVDSVPDAPAALQYLQQQDADLVVTDLQMPGLDGVELVREIRKLENPVPVVLVTAYGSERESLAALQAGAANFSHKSRLKRDLVPTASSVLDWAEKIRSWAHPVVSPDQDESRLALVLHNDVNQIPRLIEMFSDRLPHWARPDELRISMALDEALTNAICHGNLEVDSALKESDDPDRYHTACRSRLDAEPYCQRRVRVEACFSPCKIEIQIRDEGPGFNPDLLPDPTLPENIFRPSGRGLLLIRTFMDEVAHNPTGNQITLVKRPGGNPRPPRI